MELSKISKHEKKRSRGIKKEDSKIKSQNITRIEQQMCNKSLMNQQILRLTACVQCVAVGVTA